MLLSELIASEFGDIDQEAGDKLDAVARKIAQTEGGKGKVTLTFAIARKKARVMVTLVADETMPKDVPEAALFFVHPNRGLTKDDPWQTSLDQIDPATGEVVDPNAPTAPHPGES